MNKVAYLVLILTFTSTYAEVKRSPSQTLGDRVSSEFGLDRFEKTCETILSGEDIKPRSIAFYDEITKKDCLKRGKEILKESPKKYSQVLIKHDKLERSELVIRKELDE